MRLQFNGIIGGAQRFIEVKGRRTLQLQQNVVTVPAGGVLTLKNVNFLLNNEDFAFRIEIQPTSSTYTVRGGIGDLSPNRVLFRNRSSEEIRLFLLVSAINTSRQSRFLSRTDSWRFTLLKSN
ncbi:hypothetical protein ACFO9Q_03425 [Paenibacillus sp. GCM10023252]|uniref:hypothetical protein n=1 Tax=Paenibacillus sp. GCM10023252 TaxID=3252649 RepID=UPI003615333D